jgi:large subunit ribosomal protein L31
MKKDIHPKSQKIVVECSCGAKFEVMSTLNWNTRVEICSKCHPFYTWEQKILKTGAVDKFYARLKKAEELKKKASQKK